LRDLQALCAAIVPGEGDIQIHALGRGLVNESYRVSRDGRDYSLRVLVADGATIALNRDWEAKLLTLAAVAGLAPALRFCDVARGVLLSDWLPGRSGAGSLPIAGLLRRVHALPIPQPPQRMTPAAWLEHYDLWGAGNLSQRPAAQRYLREWAELPAATPVICHGDVHALNLIQSGDTLRLLDWEYAHVSDGYWDLAGWCANGDFEESSRRRLLSDYLGATPDEPQWRRLELLRWLYDYVCLQWSTLYLNRPTMGPAAAAVAQRAALLDARLSIPAN
jgi:thiamine kinase